MLLNAGFVKLFKKKEKRNIKGGISPSNENEFKKSKVIFKIYSLIYPVLFLFSQLERLSKTGYVLIVEAKNKELI